MRTQKISTFAYLTILSAVFLLVRPSQLMANSIHFGGIYLFINVPRISTKNPKFKEYEAAIQRPELDGIVIADRWMNLETQPDHFEWAPIDHWIALAVKNNKKISIGIAGGAVAPTGGFMEGTSFSGPSWLLNPPYNVDNAVITFDRNPSSPPARTQCLTAHIAKPWDTQYENRYLKMMNEMHMHFKTSVAEGIAAGSALKALRIIKLGAIGLMSYELRMGSTSASDQERCHSDPSKVWQKAGFKPQRVLEAWIKIAKGIDSIFTEKDEILSVDVIARHQAFPNVDNDGHPIPLTGSLDSLTNQIIDAGNDLFMKRFCVQWDAFGLAKHLPVMEELVAKSHKSNVAWQLNNMGRNEMTACHGPTCTSDEFAKILENAIDHEAKFIEIHVGNLVDLSYRSALQKAHEILGKR